MSVNPYVANWVNTLTKRRAERVSDLLRDSHVGKDQIQRVVERLENVDEFAPTQLNRHNSYTRMISRTVRNNARNMRGEIDELYEVAGLISTLLASQSEELSKKVEAAEREVDDLEKLVDMYSFMLADDQRYDDAYIENFHDTRGRSVLTNIPDRVGNGFDPLINFGHVRVDEGVFCISDDTLSTTYQPVVDIVKTNAIQSTNHQTPLNSILVDNNVKGWHSQFYAPRMVNAPLEEDPLGRAGVQVLLEFTLKNPVSLSEIRLAPNNNTPTEEILSLKLFSEMGSDAQGQEIVQSPPFNFKRVKTFHFPTQPVARFRLLLNQPVYNTVTLAYSDFAKEEFYYQLLENLDATIGIDRSDLGQYSLSEVINNQWDNRISDLVPDDGQFDRVVYETLVELYPEQIEQDISNIPQLKSFLTDPDDDSLPVPDFSFADDNLKLSNFQYEYDIGLKSASVMLERLANKAVFVSQAIPSSGNMGMVRLKASYDDQFVSNTDRTSEQISSVELSVSNKSEPVNESDWIPILPVGEQRIRGERLYPDKDQVATVRFLLDPNEHYIVYRNGYAVDDRSLKLHFDGLWVTTIELNIGEIAQDDIFTCDYIPAHDETRIDFEEYGFERSPLVFAHGDNQPGEPFQQTHNGRRVKLSNTPVLDIKDDSEEPIIVQLQDGTIAVNKTGETFDNDDPLAFVQRRRDLIFNQQIDQPFRVYYYHMQNNVRVRAVLRGNSKEFATPELRSFKLKGKARRPESDTA